jgi:hypothetical protein
MAQATYGFWRGFVIGLVLAAAAVLALAWFYPPKPLLPPEVDAGALEPPDAPGRPEAAAEPAAPRPESELPAAPAAPSISESPGPEAAPDSQEGATPSLPRSTP